MSADNQGDFSHPLLPWLESLAVNSDPLVPFAPQADFERTLDFVNTGDWRLDAETKKQALTIYRHSSLLVRVMSLAGGSDMDGMNLHAMLFIAAQADREARALCDAAWIADSAGPVMFAAFAVSTRLPEFQLALQEWVRVMGWDKAFSKDDLEFVQRRIVAENAPGADFWHHVSGDLYESPIEFQRACSEEMRKLEDTKRKASKGRKPPRFKDSIKVGWVPWALWARTCYGIRFVLEPDGKDDGAENRIKRDISELGISESHSGNLQRFIDLAEQSAKKCIDASR